MATSFLTEIQSSASNPRKLFCTFSSLLNPPLQSTLSADDFHTYLPRRWMTLVLPSSIQLLTLLPFRYLLLYPPLLALLPSITLSLLIRSNRATAYHLDYIPTALLQTIFLTTLVNSSLSSGFVSAALKTARVKRLLKTPSLDPAAIQNYKPISFLSFLLKALLRAVANQLSLYRSLNDFLKPF